MSTTDDYDQMHYGCGGPCDSQAPHDDTTLGDDLREMARDMDERAVQSVGSWALSLAARADALTEALRAVRASAERWAEAGIEADVQRRRAEREKDRSTPRPNFARYKAFADEAMEAYDRYGDKGNTDDLVDVIGEAYAKHLGDTATTNGGNGA